MSPSVVGGLSLWLQVTNNPLGREHLVPSLIKVPFRFFPYYICFSSILKLRRQQTFTQNSLFVEIFNAFFKLFGKILLIERQLSHLPSIHF